MWAQIHQHRGIRPHTPDRAEPSWSPCVPIRGKCSFAEESKSEMAWLNTEGDCYCSVKHTMTTYEDWLFLQALETSKIIRDPARLLTTLVSILHQEGEHLDECIALQSGSISSTMTPGPQRIRTWEKYFTVYTNSTKSRWKALSNQQGKYSQQLVNLLRIQWVVSPVP